MALLHLGTDGRQASARTGPDMAACSALVSALEGRASDLQIWARGARRPHPDVVVVASRRAVGAALRTLALAPGAARPGHHPAARGGTGGHRARHHLHRRGPRARRPRSMGEAAEALGRAVAGLPESSRQPFTPVLATLRARAPRGSGDAALARALADSPELVQGVSAYGSGEAQDYAGSARSPSRCSAPDADPLPRAVREVVLRGPARPEHRRPLRLGAGPAPAACSRRASRWATSTWSGTTTAWCG